ncbi:RxLR effector protein [Phytophthora megakarya]|uniref:RxLR effector protein n=1 Tax=Phytophthora megakarya TaxID=4795 RepID=A0A225VXG0_9STRA|nr:RxLR effector protein [Phytophthora megakarya]
MRLTFAVVAVIALFISCPATNAEPTSISSETTTNLAKDVSMKASPGSIRSLETTNDATAESRLLRSHRQTGYDDDDDIDNDGNDEEERTGKFFFKESTLDQMMNSVNTFHWFRQWKTHGLSPTDVYTRMWNKGIFDKYSRLYTMYSNNYATI